MPISEKFYNKKLIRFDNDLSKFVCLKRETRCKPFLNSDGTELVYKLILE